TQFTYVTRAISQLELYGFFSMAAFAAIYFILPRLLQTAWPSAALITAHFWCATVGLVLLSVSLLIGGWLQGQALNDVERYPEFVDVARRTAPFLIAQSLALVLLAVSHLAFLVNLVKLFFQPRAAATSSRVVFRAPPALEVAS
ncbi:MAG TPA: cbb3-type cytochrome c oxidase subunit I, partial [Candidatus Synoicihabitans sp.]|nr:cbb3-type cytochrome c oxidase subunit I [Candidatus Synoicihabitans sp.]